MSIPIVFISGVFFAGPPHAVLHAWRQGLVEIVVSPEILAEYKATGDELAIKFPGVDLTPWLEMAATEAIVVEAPPLPQQVCTDRDDDKFLACALASRTRIVTSGDKALLAVSGFKGIAVLTPLQFADRHLKQNKGDG